jgi:hypothetical protein
VKNGLILEREAEESPYLYDFDVRKPLLASVLQEVKR